MTAATDVRWYFVNVQDSPGEWWGSAEELYYNNN